MRQTLFSYERSVLVAFREVEDALVGYRTTGQARVSQHRQLADTLERQPEALLHGKDSSAGDH